MRSLHLPRWQIIGREAVRLTVLSLAFTLSYWLAFALRHDFHLPAESWQLFQATALWVVLLKLVIAYALHGFHGWMRYVSFFDLVQLFRTAVAASLGLWALDVLLLSETVPTAIVLLDFVCTVFVVGGLRCVGRFLREQFWPLVDSQVLNRNRYRKVLLVGANRSGVVLANQINFHPRLDCRVVGFLDADESLHGTRLGGIPVVGGLHHGGEVARRCSARDVLVLGGSLNGQNLRALMDECDRAGVAVKVLANVYDLVGAPHQAGSLGLRLRDVDINDLLRRDPVELDSTALATLLQDRIVLVSGAGGSIGSEICRQVLRFKPRALVLVERTENSLFQIERELRGQCGDIPLHPCLADVTDEARLRQVFVSHRPEVLFHAAAHKHVPMVEANPGEAITNNVFGTRLMADLADEFGLRSFVLISTDKAVRPSSVMGLTKHICERYVQALAGTSRTRFVVVRFGNVLGSAGSVVPIFQEQIRAGGPVTVTHPEMRRYFMTIPEASQLVLQAGAMGRGGEVFVLDMGEPVKIVDLAHDLIRLSGLTLQEISIVYTGTRPGEKLSEELYLEDERTLPTSHPKVHAAQARPYSLDEMEPLLQELGELALLSEPATIRRRLREMFPEFDPIESAPRSAECSAEELFALRPPRPVLEMMQP